MSNEALFLTGIGGDWVLGDRPVPKPGEGQVVIRNHAVALNPIDWKLQEFPFMPLNFPIVLGQDIGGVVEAVGEDVTDFKPGDRVLGFGRAPLFNNSDMGAFQNLTVLDVATVCHIPDKWSFRDAASMPMSIFTGAGLLKDAGVHLPGAPDTAGEGSKAVLIWGGRSQVGTGAIQLAHAAGITIFTTASPQHHDYLRELGADVVLDYRSETVAEDLAREAAARGVKFDSFIDAVSADMVTSARVVSALGGGDMQVVVPWEFSPAAKQSPPANVKPNPSGARGSADPKYSAYLSHGLVPKLIETGGLRPAKIQIVPGGLSGVEAGLATLKKGVSGVKLVFDI